MTPLRRVFAYLVVAMLITAYGLISGAAQTVTTLEHHYHAPHH